MPPTAPLNLLERLLFARKSLLNDRAALPSTARAVDLHTKALGKFDREIADFCLDSLSHLDRLTDNSSGLWQRAPRPAISIEDQYLVKASEDSQLDRDERQALALHLLRHLNELLRRQGVSVSDNLKKQADRSIGRFVGTFL